MNIMKIPVRKNALLYDPRRNFYSSFAILMLAALVLVSASCGAGGPISSVPISNPGGPYFGNVNQALNFDGSGSSAPSGKSLVSFAWNFGDGGTAAGAKPSHTYTVAGNYTATLTVTDSSGAIATNSVAVLIVPAPVAKPGGPYTGKVGVAVSFDGSTSTAPPGQALGFSWNFGDGSALATGAKPAHTYGSANVFTVTLTVTDDTSGISIGTTTATITAGPEPGGTSSTAATFFAIGPANASTQFAYVASSTSGVTTLSIDTIDTTRGALRAADVIPPPISGNFTPSGMTTDPTRRFLYLYGGNSILSFQIDSSTGALSPSGSVASNSGADNTGTQSFVFDPTGQFAFFIAQESAVDQIASPATIASFQVNSTTGVLSFINRYSAQVQNAQAALVEPLGKYLYISGSAVTSRFNDVTAAPQIAIFSIDLNSGALAPISASPVSIDSGFAATAMAADAGGRFIYAAGRSATKYDPALSVFSINNDTGALSQSSAPLALPDTDTVSRAVSYISSIAISPSGEFGYVMTTNIPDQMEIRNAIRIFRLNAQSGSPAAIGTLVWNTIAPNATQIPIDNFALVVPGKSAAGWVGGKTNGSAWYILSDSVTPEISVFSGNSNTGSLDWVSPSVRTTGH